MSDSKTTRRSFVKGTTAALAVGANLGIAKGIFAAGSDELRLGLVGCGGRGSGAAAQALRAEPGVKLVAMADAFMDRVEEYHKQLKEEDIGDRVDVPPERRFAGFDAYQKVLDQVDVAVLAATPHFRPEHLEYAVEKGVHTFCEKPIGTDSPGVRRFLAACEKAREKNVSIASGFCWRYHSPRIETMKRVFDGAIGDPVAIQTVYNSGGVWNPRKRPSEVDSEMELQIRNWYYYTWLSGDHIVEQAIHGIDTMGWVMGDKPPLQCWGTGGRQVRTDPVFGNIYDHFSIVYEYENGVRGYHTCRHWKGCESLVNDRILGTKGSCDVFAHVIEGENPWKYEGQENDMYQTEHDVLFRAIRSGETFNNGEAMGWSTLLGVMGRMAAYTGETIAWEEALNSEQKFGPDKYEWGPAPECVVAVPGKTKIA